MCKKKVSCFTITIILCFAIELCFLWFLTPGKNTNQSQTIKLSVNRFQQNATKSYSITLNTNETIFYVDAWRSHWCPYYNEREFFLTPRINEFEHLARSRGFRIMHLNWKGDESNIDQKIRKIGRELASKGMTEDIKSTYPNNMEDSESYIPGFVDNCIYKNFSRYGETRSTRPNYALSLSKDDIVAQNFKSVAAEALALKAKTVVILGMHTNLCIHSVAQLLKISNISVGFVDGLLDAAYYYPYQKNTIKTHSQQNRVCTKYMSEKYGWISNVYNILSKMRKMKPIATEPEWILNKDRVTNFRRYYKKISK